jgi:hypothetical protein
MHALIILMPALWNLKMSDEKETRTYQIRLLYGFQIQLVAATK